MFAKHTTFIFLVELNKDLSEDILFESLISKLAAMAKGH